MYLLITMAGLYTRFSPFSYQVPKYLLPLSNRTVLHQVLANLLKDGVFERVLLVANERDSAFKPQIVSTIKEFGFTDSDLIFIGDTQGQAETALIGGEAVGQGGKDVGIAVHNVDTILLQRDMWSYNDQLNSSACVIDVFTANNKEYSYVQVSDKNEVVSIREKVVISNIASSGLYCFESINLMLQCLRESIENNESYISHGIRQLLSQGKQITIGPIYNENQTIVVGTPEEYVEAAAVFDLFNKTS